MLICHYKYQKLWLSPQLAHMKHYQMLRAALLVWNSGNCQLQKLKFKSSCQPWLDYYWPKHKVLIPFLNPIFVTKITYMNKFILAALYVNNYYSSRVKYRSNYLLVKKIKIPYRTICLIYFSFCFVYKRYRLSI